MNEKIEQLKDLLEQSTLKTQHKLNRIVQTLQRTDDFMKAKILSKKVLNGEFDNLKDKAVDNLIKAFTVEDLTKNEFKEEFKQLDNITEEDILKKKNRIIEDEKNESITNDLQKQLKDLKLKMEIANADSTKRIRDLEADNSKLIKMLKLTKNTKLIEVSDDDIDKLYIEYKKNGLEAYNGAFVSGDIIAKSYYKIK